MGQPVAELHRVEITHVHQLRGLTQAGGLGDSVGGMYGRQRREALGILTGRMMVQHHRLDHGQGQSPHAHQPAAHFRMGGPELLLLGHPAGDLAGARMKLGLVEFARQVGGNRHLADVVEQAGGDGRLDQRRIRFFLRGNPAGEAADPA